MSVVIAYRDMGCPYRRASFAYVHAWWGDTLARWAEDFGWRSELLLEEGTSDTTFTRASAINAGVRRAAGHVIVQADPDNLVDPDQLREAVALAADQDGLVLPHDRYVRLGADATADFLNGRRQLDQMIPPDYEGPGGHGEGSGAVGGVAVFSRNTWQTCGGFDERFGLWSGDDSAYAYCAAAFCGPHRRLSGDVTHLWHPRLPQSEIGSPGYIDQMAILGPYRDAAAIGPDAVRALVAAR